MTPYDPQKHHRRSIRLAGYNYAQPGAYFITLVAHQRASIFGQIVAGEMRLSSLGQIAREEWMRSINVRHEIRLNEDEFIIMPNHIHAIVWIVDPVGADGIRPIPGEDAVRPIEKTIRPTHRLPRSLSSFAAGFKAAVTSRARKELALSDIWQRNYYDHIIRNEREFDKIWAYIDTNPQRWQEDQLHPFAPAN